jgi:hypothetical protein
MSMSLDRRLRAELDADARHIDADVERSLDVVQTRARRPNSLDLPLVGVAAIVLGVVLAGRFLPSLPGSGGATAAPTASATASPAAACPPIQGTCLGPLQPGVHSSRTFAPAFTYTVPAGWDNTLDTHGQLDLTFVTGGAYTYPDGTKFHDAISIFRHPLAASPSEGGPIEGIGYTASVLTDWLTTHVDLATAGRTKVTIGGAAGYRLEIALAATPRTSPDHCTTDHGEARCESLFVSDDAASPFGFGIVGPETCVVYLLDAPSGDTVMVVIDDVDGVDAAGLVAAATPVVESFRFTTAIRPSPSP